MYRWMWECEDIQKDLIVLQEKYKQLGYTFTLEQCYDIWATYSDYCSANWLYISDIEKSLKFIDKIESNKLK